MDQQPATPRLSFHSVTRDMEYDLSPHVGYELEESTRFSMERGLLDHKQRGWASGTLPRPARFRSKRLHWSVLSGWIALAYMLALATAAANFGVFRYLEGKRPKDTIDQNQQTFYANMMVMLFQSTLVYATGAAFTQRAWYTFRQKSLKVAMVDKLLSLPTAPLGFVNWDIFTKHHVEWWYGFFVLATSIAVTFPPSAMIVQSVDWRPNNTTVLVPTLDLEAFGFGTEKAFNDTDFFTYQGGYTASGRNISRLYQFTNLALFTVDDDLYYVSPKPQIQAVSQMSMLSGQVITPQIPQGCVTNCTYSTIILGPRFECQYIDPTTTFAYAQNGSLDGAPKVAFAAYDSPPAGLPEYDRWLFVNSFQLSWYPYGPMETNSTKSFLPLQAMDCITSFAVYNVTTNFTFGSGKFQTYDTISTASWNAADFNKDSMNFYNNFFEEAKSPAKDLLVKLRRASAFAVRQAVVNTLSGVITIEEKVRMNNTQILGTTLGSLDPTGRSVTLNITTSNVEELLRNATFSLMSLNLFNTTTNATLHNYANVYAFDPAYNLIIPYAVCLGVGLILIIIGAIALEKNGVSASDGFIQTLCTTQASDSIRKVAQTGARGNNEHLPKEVLRMKIQYGAIGAHHGPTEVGEAGEEDEIELDMHSKHEGLIGFGQPDIDHFVPFS